MNLPKNSIRRALFRGVFPLLTLLFYLVFDLLFFPSQTLAQLPSVRAGNKTSHLIDSDQISKMLVPPELGFIDESYNGKSGKTILYIQDAHDSLEAQENIAKIIRPNRIDVKVGGNSLQRGRHPLQPHARVDVLAGQWT